METLSKVPELLNYSKLEGQKRLIVKVISKGVASDFYDEGFIKRYGIQPNKTMIQLKFIDYEDETKEVVRAFGLSSKSKLSLFKDAFVGSVYEVMFQEGKIIYAKQV